METKERRSQSLSAVVEVSGGLFDMFWAMFCWGCRVEEELRGWGDLGIGLIED